ncbi:dipeptidyl peptidase IV N-terminal region-domain-containing protein [Chytriomyces sp. MP71]|nr:dipeptidyl peptidase IV N-terminal region-domain-containing protein [Chytriomyces sp. MP71]
MPEVTRQRNASADVEADPLVGDARTETGNAEESAGGGPKNRTFRLLNWRNSSLIEARIHSVLRQPGVVLAALALMLVAIVLLSLRVPEDPKTQSAGAEGLGPDGTALIPFDLEALHSGLFDVDYSKREWVAGARDGSYIMKEPDSSLTIHHVDLSEKTILASSKDLINEQSHTPLQYTGYIPSPSLKHVLFESNVLKGWRHSFFATYHVFDVEKKTLKLLASTEAATADPAGRETPGSGDGKDQVLGRGHIALTVWAPNGESIAWVRDNNLFVTSVETHAEVQITTDGSFDILNGLADWVYEEEVYASNQAVWFSPDATKLAYLKFDDSKVPSYKLQMFFEGAGVSQQYPDDISIKYPKAGTNNPMVSLHIADPSASSALTRDIPITFVPPESLYPDDDRLIVEVKWMEDHDSLLVRMMNRVQDQQRVFVVRAPSENADVGMNGTAPAWTATLVRDEKSRDGAWLTTQLQSIYPLPISKTASRSQPQYLELAEDEKGNTHLAYYTSITAKVPATWLTTGDFEVTKIAHMDAERNMVFYLSTAKGSTQRHLFSARIVENGKSSETKLTPPKGITWTSSVRSWSFKNAGGANPNSGIGDAIGEVGWYEASFSKGGGHYLLTYKGPDVPFQKIVSLYDNTLDFPFKTNEKVSMNLKNHFMPKELITSIPVGGGVEVNAKLVVPNDFDASNSAKKYPMLIKVYGGPNSQSVTQSFNLEFETALAAEGYVIMTVDPRGTCCKGRDFRAIISKQLGKVESADIIAAARFVVKMGFVDSSKIAIWGWSYGGFLASKVIEADSGVITTGVAVAPVTDWKFYDSIYTERYMKTPLMNPKGYETSAVSNMSGFKNADFLLVHGTGDDNVHFQNSLSLIWKLTAGSVHRYQVQFYPDSDHSMSAGNAFWELFDLLHRFLDGKFEVLAKGADAASRRWQRGGDVELDGRHGSVGVLEWDVIAG